MDPYPDATFVLQPSQDDHGAQDLHQSMGLGTSVGEVEVVADMAQITYDLEDVPQEFAQTPLSLLLQEANVMVADMEQTAGIDDEPVHFALSPRLDARDDGLMVVEDIDDEPVHFALSPRLDAHDDGLIVVEMEEEISNRVQDYSQQEPNQFWPTIPPALDMGLDVQMRYHAQPTFYPQDAQYTVPGSVPGFYNPAPDQGYAQYPVPFDLGGFNPQTVHYPVPEQATALQPPLPENQQLIPMQPTLMMPSEQQPLVSPPPLGPGHFPAFQGGNNPAVVSSPPMIIQNFVRVENINVMMSGQQ